MNKLVLHLLCCLALGSCASRDTALTQPAADKPAGADVERGLLVTQADQAFADSLRPDYRRPHAQLPDGRVPVAALYLKACRAGDLRSCWLAMELHDPEGAAVAQVQGNCQRGDRLSCRALPGDQTDEARKDLPGWAGRSRACLRLESCDLTALAKECEGGFPASCRQQLLLHRPPPDMIGPDYRDPPAMVIRILALARQGCRSGVVGECNLLLAAADAHGKLPDADRQLAYERLCDISLDQCSWLGWHYLERDQPLKARDALERDCQANPYGFCSAAAAGYLQHSYPEPVPGRGEALWKWGCERGETCARPPSIPAPR